MHGIGKICIAGVGPGSKDYLTIRAKEATEDSDVIAGHDHALNAVHHILKDKKVYRLSLDNWDEIISKISSNVENGKKCSILCTGDPGFSDKEFVLRILCRFPSAEIIPGISSIQVAAAKAKIPWDEAILMTFHVSGEIDRRKRILLERINSGEVVLLLPRPWDFMPKDIAEYLISSGVDESTPAIVYENLTMDDESEFRGNLKDLLDREFGDLSVMIIEPSR